MLMSGSAYYEQGARNVVVVIKERSLGSCNVWCCDQGDHCGDGQVLAKQLAL